MKHSEDEAVPGQGGRALVAPFADKRPRFGQNVFLAPTCSIIGDVELGDNVSIWYASVLRGDVHRIVVGKDSNVQDGSVFHGTLGEWPVLVGERVSIGHSAMVHGAVIEDDCIIGIGARVLDGVTIGHHTLVAAGAVVREGTVIPPRSLVVGVPAKVKRELTDEEIERITRTPARYSRLAAENRKGLIAAGYADPIVALD